jgi:hypothetical protein
VPRLVQAQSRCTKIMSRDKGLVFLRARKKHASYKCGGVARARSLCAHLKANETSHR